MSKARKLLSTIDLADIFGGVKLMDLDKIKQHFSDDMTSEAIIQGEELGMVRCLPLETQRLLRQYILRGYVAGYTKCEIELIAQLRERAKQKGTTIDEIIAAGYKADDSQGKESRV